MKWIGRNDRPDGAVDGEEVVWGNSEQDFDVWEQNEPTRCPLNRKDRRKAKERKANKQRENNKTQQNKYTKEKKKKE